MTSFSNSAITTTPPASQTIAYPAASATVSVAAFPAASASTNLTGMSVGKLTTWTPSIVSVSVASTVALNNNASASYRLFINDSDTTIYLMPTTSATASYGIRLNANGGAYEMSRFLGNLVSTTINAITPSGTTATKTLLVNEGT